MKLWIKSLFRSPVRTVVTWILLAAAAFQFALSLTDYLATRRGLSEAKERMKGALAVEHSEARHLGVPGSHRSYSTFLYSDPAAGVQLPERYQQENQHPQSITADEIEAIAALPGVDGVELRGMTAGIANCLRPDNPDSKLGGYSSFLYEGRLILEGTVRERTATDDFWAVIDFPNNLSAYKSYDEEASCILTLEDVRVLGGSEAALPVEEDGSSRVFVLAMKEETRGEIVDCWYGISDRLISMSYENCLYPEDLNVLEPGKRVLLACRVETKGDNRNVVSMVLGDETLKNWWPYITDVTDLPENYLETDDFAPLRELIQVTNDDWHTMDVVYTGDMSVIRRATELRLIPAQGRFIQPEDAGSPVCVVNEAFAQAQGLQIGDTLRLRLGDYPMEQHEVLGAVASARARYAKNWTEQEFTIVGTWLDSGQGNFQKEDYFWAYSDATVFVPSSFLPEGAKKADYCPGEVTFLIDTDVMNDFVAMQLPELETQGWTAYWNDRGWPQMQEELRTVVQAALYKLLAFTVATLLVIALTVYLFISRRSRDYAILRAWGMNKRRCAKSLLIPLLCLTLAAVIPGSVAAFLWYHRNGAQVSPVSFVSIPALMILPMLAAMLLLRRMGKSSPLTLLQTRSRK